jgi:hypothetical protein
VIIFIKKKNLIKFALPKELLAYISQFDGCQTEPFGPTAASVSSSRLLSQKS